MSTAAGPVRPRFDYPTTSLGMPVTWAPYPGAHEIDSALGFVTRSGRNGVCEVIIFPPGSMTGIPKDGVRFHADPEVAKFLDQGGGVWDFTEHYRSIQEVLTWVRSQGR